MNNQYSDFEYTDYFLPMTVFDESGVVGHLFMLLKDETKFSEIEGMRQFYKSMEEDWECIEMELLKEDWRLW